MAAYVVTMLQLLDEAAAAVYRPLARASVAAHGGRYLARGPDESRTGPDRLVIIEFPSLQVALQWRDCDCYRDATAWRDKAMRSRVMIVDGIPWEGS